MVVFLKICGLSEYTSWLCVSVNFHGCSWNIRIYRLAVSMNVHKLSNYISWLCVSVNIHGLPVQKNNTLYCMCNIVSYNPVFILGQTLQVSLECQQTSHQTTCIMSLKTAVCMSTAVTTTYTNLYLSTRSTSYSLSYLTA